ncbi:MAG: AAA family ATPase, partial [Dehalococcoidia bacterium]
MGGEVTPRADLYSLGAMLYEMVTGRPPFLGDDSVAIIGQHINTPPVAPTWHCPECPRPLEALILRLLAKDPSERPQSATDVSAALEAVDLAVSAETSQPLDEGHALDSLAGGVFVGRQREMGELKAALEDALSGRGRLVTLVGEPGIGKTRTAQELATYAGLRGTQVLWGRCYEEQGMPPYWPWVQAIRSYVREREPEQLRSEMGAGAADIAEVVSDVRERLPEVPTPPQLDSPEQARFRLFDSIAAFLKSASQRQALMLVLDDLHWADQPSLLLLQFLAREIGGGRLLLVGTYRDVELSRQHPLAETLGELTRERLFQRVLLRGLGQEDVARFVEIATGIVPPSGLTQAVFTQTEGNPLFVTEVVRLLVQEGELTQERRADRDSWSVRIPEGVREVIGRRLNRLSQRCNETLTIASVIGREFTLDQLKPLIEDLTEDRLLEVLEEALAARVIEELPQVAGRYQFTHALIQETLFEELTLTRRVRLHGRIAQTLEALYAGNLEAHAAELAHHFGQAEASLGSDKLIHYSLMAGNRALEAYAWEEAMTHFQRGLGAKEDHLIDSDTASLLFGLGQAQSAFLERRQSGIAVATLSRAFDCYLEIGDIARAINVAMQPLATAHTAQVAGAGQLISRALALVPIDSLEAGYLLAREITESGRVRGDYQAAQNAFEQVMKIAGRAEDKLLEMRALTNAADVDTHHCRFAEALEKSRKAIDLADQVDDLRTEALAHGYASINLLSLGCLEEARLHTLTGLNIAERVRQRALTDTQLTHSATLATLMGDFQTAREYIDRVRESSPGESGRVSLTYLALEIGDFTELEEQLVLLLERADNYPSDISPSTTFPAFFIPVTARGTGDASLTRTATWRSPA